MRGIGITTPYSHHSAALFSWFSAIIAPLATLRDRFSCCMGYGQPFFEPTLPVLAAPPRHSATFRFLFSRVTTFRFLFSRVTDSAFWFIFSLLSSVLVAVAFGFTDYARSLSSLEWLLWSTLGISFLGWLLFYFHGISAWRLREGAVAFFHHESIFMAKSFGFGLLFGINYACSFLREPAFLYAFIVLGAIAIFLAHFLTLRPATDFNFIFGSLSTLLAYGFRVAPRSWETLILCFCCCVLVVLRNSHEEYVNALGGDAALEAVKARLRERAQDAAAQVPAQEIEMV